MALAKLPATLLLALMASPVMVQAARNSNATTWNAASGMSQYQLSAFATTPNTLVPPEKCPPCFNCLLPAFTCGQYGHCNKYDGQCECPAGWGGQDCLIPQCDSLADGNKRRLRKDGEKCECKDGWGGLNCNVCKRNDACANFPLLGKPQTDELDGDVDPEDMLCYTAGETVFNNHQTCDVTNAGILEQLEGRIPQVTFACDKNSSTCDFQFWVDQVESFYCALQECDSSLKPGYENGTDTLTYACSKMQCKCVPGRFICGENGSVDIGDFLVESIRGPATFKCKNGSDCRFEEPAMNELIDSVFGDNFISLKCEGGECLHKSQVPGYVRPPKPDNTQWIAVSLASAGALVLAVCAILWYVGRANKGEFGNIRLPADESARLMSDHVPATLHFKDIAYTLPSAIGSSSPAKPILAQISGKVGPGQVLAIMGASGAGKSTFLDILARKPKRGTVTGTTSVNGREVPDDQFRRVCGFVDQEDTLMRTLTVYETVLYSALLRLPREMSNEAKKYRVMETLNELGIMSIKDSRIGDSSNRGISGGEKRRVSIACELVTSPSILFLDEPTSGLDAYNAFNVIDSLVSLARNYQRTVVFTIHQPRSNIVSLFDQLLVLAQGRVVYSGEFAKTHAYLDSIGHPCPPGFNIADFLIDLTSMPPADGSDADADVDDSIPRSPTATATDDGNIRDEERGLLRPFVATRASSSNTSDAEETELRTRNRQNRTSNQSTAASVMGSIRKRTSRLFSSGAEAPSALPPFLSELVEAFAKSELARELDASAANGHGNGNGVLPDVEVETNLLKGRKRASLWTQFRILSGRAFKNLYRDPALLATHYIASFVLALVAGGLFHNVGNDIAGFQNRLGFFFFTLALFGFSCLSSLGLFHTERVLYMRERSNGYYSSFTYFSSKVLFDILPLRVVPPFVFAAIAYPLIGLVGTPAAYWKFMLTLVLFNLTTASVCLLLSVGFENLSVASFIGTLVMLFNLLFTGLLINRNTVPSYLRWLITGSFFHAAYEAMAVNELRYLKLTERKYGVELEVPAASILSTFGFSAQAFWWPDISLLGIFFGLFTVLSYLLLHYHVKERR